MWQIEYKIYLHTPVQFSRSSQARQPNYLLCC